ncbi:MAG: hypothetical protein N2554_11565 [Fimbriimonadales bacterium]|nr:hypothetical protein [Fimbriimonadales bacterium]
METIFVAMLVWLLAAAWIFFLVSWAVTGDVTAGEAIIGSAVALLLALATARQAFPYVGTFSLLTLGGGAVGLPILRAYLNRLAHAQMDAELIERACLAYEFDPKNYGSLINLAEVCYRNGLLEQAVYHLERAIQTAPIMAANEKRRLTMWKDELQHAHQLGYTPCMHCGARQAVGAVRCDRCGQLVLPLLVQGRWIPRQLMQKVFWVWVVSVSAIALSLFWGEQLMGLSALLAILTTLATALGLIVWIIRKP